MKKSPSAARVTRPLPRLSVSGLLLLAVVVMPLAAHAQGSSPFDSGMTAIQTLFTGTIAKVSSLIAIVIGGYSFAHGEPGAKKTLAGVAAGTGIAMLAVNVLTWLWGVYLPETVVLRLLKSQRCSCRVRRVFLESSMHSFMTPVLLWPPGLDTFMHDAHLHPEPVMAMPTEHETEEQAAERQAASEPQREEHEVEQKRREEKRKADFVRQQEEFEDEQAQREEQRKARIAAFERITVSVPCWRRVHLACGR